MKRDLYAEVSARIVAELERGAPPWVKPWSATAGMNTPCNAVTNRPYSGCNVVLLWMARAAGYRAPRFLTYKQALELGGHVRKGERGTKVYFVKQLEVRDKDSDDEFATRIVPMLREYTVFNVDQCENLPARVITLGNTKPRNPDQRDTTVDEFLACSPGSQGSPGPGATATFECCQCSEFRVAFQRSTHISRHSVGWRLPPGTGCSRPTQNLTRRAF